VRSLAEIYEEILLRSIIERITEQKRAELVSFKYEHKTVEYLLADMEEAIWRLAKRQLHNMVKYETKYPRGKVNVNKFK
jgi:hypothetical protein